MGSKKITKSVLRRLNIQMTGKELAEFLGRNIPCYILSTALDVSQRFEQLIKEGVESYDMDFTDILEEL